MISEIGKNENEFVDKLIKFTSIFAETNYYSSKKNWISEVTTYKTSIDNKEIYEFFLLWIESKLNDMDYDKQEIKKFFTFDMQYITSTGIQKKSILENKEREFSYFEVVMFSFSIIGILLVPSMLSSHFKLKSYKKIEGKMFKEFKDTIKRTKSKKVIFKIFDKYFEMI